jgi:hypothetical protein
VIAAQLKSFEEDTFMLLFYVIAAQLKSFEEDTLMRYTWEKGERWYVGEWKDGRPHGKGTMTVSGLELVTF